MQTKDHAEFTAQPARHMEGRMKLSQRSRFPHTLAKHGGTPGSTVAHLVARWHTWFTHLSLGQINKFEISERLFATV